MPTATRKREGKEVTDAYAQVTDQILASLEAGVVPWHQPWITRSAISLSTGKAYRGVNVMLLAMSANAQGFGSNYWGTYNQCESRGGQVRKGERGTLITLWKTLRISEVVDGKKESKTIPMLRTYKVFNADQCDPITEGVTLRDGSKAQGYMRLPKAEDARGVTPLGAAESILSSYFATSATSPLLHEGGSAAYYSPSTDAVTLPARDDFKSTAAFYSTAFHEATHSTGHKSRLNRPGIVEAHHFGDELYAAEELIAELGAAMLCNAAGIENVTVPQSAAYISSWLHVLRNDRKLVVSAAGKAQKAADLVQGIAAPAQQ